MNNQVDLNKYTEFVEKVTSDESNSLPSLMDRMNYLKDNFGYGPNGEYIDGPSVNVSLLLTSAIGLGSETGEFQEIVKKIFFQGKPLTDDTIFHLKRELGDILWYWINACRALHLDPNDVIAENVRKLSSRYPGGQFDVYYSENRKEGDL